MVFIRSTISVWMITDSVSERVVDSWFYSEITSVLRPHHNILIQNPNYRTSPVRYDSYGIRGYGEPF